MSLASPLVLAVVLFADVVVAQPPSTAVAAVERVEIHSMHVGESSAKKAELILVRTPKGFSDGSHVVDERLVDNLVVAATARPIAVLDPTRFVVDEAALKREAQQLARRYAPQTGARFVSRVLDPKQIGALIKADYDSTSADDYPSMRVDIVLRDKTRMVIRSEAPQPLMLPWTVERSTGTVTTYNSELSHAIAELLPEHFLNRHRIVGVDLPELLPQLAFLLWDDELRLLSIDEQFGPQLEPLRRRLHVRFSDAAIKSSADASAESELHAVLTTPSPRVTYFVRLPIRQGRLADPDAFLRDADAMTRRVKALPWVRRYLANHAGASVTIDYYENKSLAPDNRQKLIETLRDGGHADVAASVEPMLDRSIEFYVDAPDKRFSVWVLLPDGRSILTFGDRVRGAPAVEIGDAVDLVDGQPRRGRSLQRRIRRTIVAQRSNPAQPTLDCSRFVAAARVSVRWRFLREIPTLLCSSEAVLQTPVIVRSSGDAHVHSTPASSSGWNLSCLCVVTMSDSNVRVFKLSDLRGGAQRGLSRRSFCASAGAGLVALGLPACAPGDGRIGTGRLDSTGGLASDEGGAAPVGVDSGAVRDMAASHPGVDGASGPGPTDASSGPGAMCANGLLNAGSKASYNLDIAKLFSNGGNDLFVMKDAGGFYAMSALCTHLGCVLKQRTSDLWCNCHLATFDFNGQNPTNPAPTPLDHYAVCIDSSGTVWVDSSTTVDASTRAS